MSINIPDFTTRLLTDAGIKKGMRVLDVGCGSGDVSFLLLDLVGTDGEIIAVDHDAQALAIARQRIGAQHQPGLTFLQHDLLEMPCSIGIFDTIVGRRVLMYQRDAVATLRALSKCLRPGGIMVFQEHDTTMVPASLDSFPLHQKAQGWIQAMIAREGADLNIGFHLHSLFTRAGLAVESVRAECLVQTPDTPYNLGKIVRACLPRITALGVASAEEVGIETLQERLDDERSSSPDIYIGDMMFGGWARKNNLYGGEWLCQSSERGLAGHDEGVDKSPKARQRSRLDLSYSARHALSRKRKVTSQGLPPPESSGALNVLLEQLLAISKEIQVSAL